TSCKAPSACFAFPCSWVFTSPVARPNPSSTWPPKFLALPVRRSSFMGVILLRFASSTARAGVGSHCAAEMATDDFGLRRLRVGGSGGRALRRASKPAAAVLLFALDRRFFALDRRFFAPEPFHPDTRSEHADRQQRNELTPADGAARLNCTTQHFGVEPNRGPARRQRQRGLLDRSAARPQTQNGGDNRRQKEKAPEYHGRSQR